MKPTLANIHLSYVALTHGKPSRMNEEACDVRLPEDLERDLVPSLEGGSQGSQDGSKGPVSLCSYVRYRTKIYMIASSLSRDMYLTRPSHPNLAIQRANALHQRLLEWERSVPRELRLETYSGTSLEGSHRRRFAMLAMALQIAYDNIQLALFRPFMSDSRCASPAARPLAGLSLPEDDIFKIGFQQCFISAMRTSMIGSEGSLPILRSMKNSPINIHLGVHAFAAGVVLGLLALKNPVSPVGQDCKRSIARLIHASKAAGLTALVWTQAAGVLADLMHVVASEEVNALLEDRNEKTTVVYTANMSSFGAPPEWYGPGSTGDLEGTGNPGVSSVGATVQTPSSDTLVGTNTTEGWTGDAHGTGSRCQSHPTTSLDGTFDAVGGLDLSPFSEFTVENYTLYNYGQAWMIGDTNFSI